MHATLKCISVLGSDVLHLYGISNDEHNSHDGPGAVSYRRNWHTCLYHLLCRNLFLALLPRRTCSKDPGIDSRRGSKRLIWHALCWIDFNKDLKFKRTVRLIYSNYFKQTCFNSFHERQNITKVTTAISECLYLLTVPLTPFEKQSHR